MRRVFVLLVLSVLVHGCASSPPAPPVDAKPYIEVTSRTARLSCEGRASGEPFGSRLGRSAVLVAPVSGRRGYAEVMATATEWSDGARDCRNLSRLHVAEPGGDYGVAFEQNPGAEGQTGNSIELMDWSPDGERLLMELTLWTYPTDVVNPLIVLYDARTNIVRQLPIYQLLKERYPGKCFLELRALGFTPEGGVVVSAGPLSRTFSSAGPSCTTDRVLWMYHEGEEAIEALPLTYPMRKWARQMNDRKIEN
jgi:hypothetical protein